MPNYYYVAAVTAEQYDFMIDPGITSPGPSETPLQILEREQKIHRAIRAEVSGKHIIIQSYRRYSTLRAVGSAVDRCGKKMGQIEFILKCETIENQVAVHGYYTATGANAKEHSFENPIFYNGGFRMAPESYDLVMPSVIPSFRRPPTDSESSSSSKTATTSDSPDKLSNHPAKTTTAASFFAKFSKVTDGAKKGATIALSVLEKEVRKSLFLETLPDASPEKQKVLTKGSSTTTTTAPPSRDKDRPAQKERLSPPINDSLSGSELTLAQSRNRIPTRTDTPNSRKPLLNDNNNHSFARGYHTIYSSSYAADDIAFLPNFRGPGPAETTASIQSATREDSSLFANPNNNNNPKATENLPTSALQLQPAIEKTQQPEAQDDADEHNNNLATNAETQGKIQQSDPGDLENNVSSHKTRNEVHPDSQPDPDDAEEDSSRIFSPWSP